MMKKDSTKQVEEEKTATTNNTTEDTSKEKDPEPSTESSGEVIKPGGQKEKNPKKMN